MRERNGWRAIPAAAVGSCGFLFVAAFGIRAIPDSRLPAAAWVLAWASAGVVSHWLAVEFRGQLWLYFAPIGADYDDHHARMILRGGYSATSPPSSRCRTGRSMTTCSTTRP